MTLTKIGFPIILLVVLLAVLGCEQTGAAKSVAREKIVIAHRGASGYLPEHTIAAKAMAYAQGADFIEQDLVMTHDDAIIVLHDVHLDTVTNVHDLYPGRAREDGRYYAIDFTLAEIRQLSVFERISRHDENPTAVFESRFPVGVSTFRVHTLAEEIELIQGLNQSTGGSTGIYPEIKKPAFHREHGKDISMAVLEVLKEYGYTDFGHNIYLQCFDAAELQRIFEELMPEAGVNLPLVQLLGTESAYEPLLTTEGLRHIAGYAVGIGPSLDNLVVPGSAADNLQTTGLTGRAHAEGLKIHAYTFRRDAGQVPEYAEDFEDLMRIFLVDVGIDGVFTDFPDTAVKFLEQQNADLQK